MTQLSNRRDFLRTTGIGSVAGSMLMSLPSFGSEKAATRKQRVVFLFSPNGVIPKHFWPEKLGTDYDLKRILEPLAPFKKQMMTLHGVCNMIRGDGDGHMRGIGCLLTGIELFPGDVQGGSDTPAGWSKGISIDQHLRNHFQAKAETQTRFGSLEFGVMVPERADTWTRMSYAGPNQPVAPIDDPYQMFNKLYGQKQNQELLASVLDPLMKDFKAVEKLISAEDRKLLQEHMAMVRKIEQELEQERRVLKKASAKEHVIPNLPPNVREVNDNMPQICRMQMDMLVNSLAADFTRVASFQITNSVGQPKMKWLGIDEGHHTLSHEPDSNEAAYEKLIKINTWYAEQVAYLAKRLSETPEPGGDGSLLDNTTIVWTNELGKGNSHTRNNIPFVLVGGGFGWKMGQAIDFRRVPHNRLLMAMSEAMGVPVKSFGNPKFCKRGALTGLT